MVVNINEAFFFSRKSESYALLEGPAEKQQQRTPKMRQSLGTHRACRFTATGHERPPGATPLVAALGQWKMD